MDLVAKVSADKGVPFDFANNARLKESGFALEGVTVNGFVNQNGVTLNIDSAKALNSVVGHEITHVLEGTELYDALKSSITEYAKSKGEYDSRLQALTKLYKDKEGYTGEDADAKIEQELVADLVGDYLFSDPDFIRNLSTEHRNVFDKLFAEVKYLCKVATAGSKEGRQLEKVKKAFEEAYRTETKNPTAEGGVKYALGDGTTKDASELSRSDLQYLLENAQNGSLSDSSYIPLRRNTPAFFIGVVEEHSEGAVVIEDHPMAATVEHLRQNMEEEDGQSYGSTRPHGFSVDDIITISEKMGDPSYIVLQKNGRYAEVVSFYNDRKKQVVVAIDFANSNPAESKNFKYSQYMNGYGGGYYNIIVTQYEPDNFAQYLKDCEIVYSKKEMNGKYQVGSGRVVTVTHDTPFIENIIAEKQPGVKQEDSVKIEQDDITPVQRSLSSADDIAPLPGGIYGKDIALDDDIPIRWGIKKDASLGGVGRGTNNRISHGASSDASNNIISKTKLGVNKDAAKVEPRATRKELHQGIVERKIENTQVELDKNRQFRDEALKDYDEEIARAQAELDAKKNKDTKAAQVLRRRIERLNRLKADIDADYSKRKKCADAKPSAH